MGIESIAQNLQMSSLQQQVSTNQNSVVSDNMKANTDLNDRAQKAEGAAKTQAIAEEMVSEEELKKAVDETKIRKVVLAGGVSANSGLRNRIVHDYGNVDLQIVFDTLKNDIPELLELIV